MFPSIPLSESDYNPAHPVAGIAYPSISDVSYGK